MEKVNQTMSQKVTVSETQCQDEIVNSKFAPTGENVNQALISENNVSSCELASGDLIIAMLLTDTILRVRQFFTKNDMTQLSHLLGWLGNALEYTNSF